MASIDDAVLENWAAELSVAGTTATAAHQRKIGAIVEQIRGAVGGTPPSLPEPPAPPVERNESGTPLVNDPPAE